MSKDSKVTSCTHIIDHGSKAHGEIAQGDDDVAANNWVLARLENAEQEFQVRLTELRAHTHELRQ